MALPKRVRFSPPRPVPAHPKLDASCSSCSFCCEVVTLPFPLLCSGNLLWHLLWLFTLASHARDSPLVGGGGGGGAQTTSLPPFQMLSDASCAYALAGWRVSNLVYDPRSPCVATMGFLAPFAVLHWSMRLYTLPMWRASAVLRN